LIAGIQKIESIDRTVPECVIGSVAKQSLNATQLSRDCSVAAPLAM